MTRYAFIFPGQASQEVGMGLEIYQQSPRAGELYEAAENFLNFPLKKLSFQGPLEELTKTQYTQPAIFVLSCALDLLLKERGIIPQSAAGHSLGEYSALVSASAITFEQGLKLVKLRGELMAKAGEIQPGSMSAIIGLEAEVIEEICSQTPGIVVPANYNSPGQLVISGQVDAVKEAGETAKQKGAKMVLPLTVSGAFHSPLMEYACEKFNRALNETKFNPPTFPVFANVTAESFSNPLEIKELLKLQLLKPVKWEQTIHNMLKTADCFLEVGPGKVLTGLMKRIDKSLNAKSVSNFTDMLNLVPH
jgi:[acyl-carrier-protein] S-malonyltransferase